MRILNNRDSFYQWDSNQHVVHNFNVGDEVHFFNMRQPSALIVKAYRLNNEVVADVPNILLQSSYPINVYWMHLDQNGKYTKDEFTFNVNQRPKPSDYVYTETEVLSYKDLDDRINHLEGEGLANAVEAYLKENPVQAGATEEEAKQIAQNKTDIENLSTEKLDATELPTAINTALAQAKASGEFDGADGKDGKDGQDGYTPQKNVDYFDGKDGTDGKDGADGYTPKKYIDYFTEADKVEMVNAVLAALPVAERGSF